MSTPPPRRHSSAPSTPTWLHSESVIAGRLLVIGIAAAAAIWLALRVQFIVTAVVLGFAIVALLWPLARWLRARRVPSVLAAIICVLLFLAFFVGIVIFVVAQVIESAPRIADAVTGAIADVNDWLASGPFGLDTDRVQELLGELESMLGDVLQNAAPVAAAGLSALGNLFTVVLIAMFFAIFALTSGDKLWRQFVGTLDSHHKEPATAAFVAGMRTTGNWFYASTITGLVDGAFIGIGLTILDVPLAIPIGALTFLMAYIPLVGATLAGVVAVLVAFFSGGLADGLWALGIVILVQQIEGNILSPLLMSRALNFHPLVMLVLTTGAAAAFGLIGLFLAVPVVGAIAAAVIAWKKKVRAIEEAEAAEAETAVAAASP